VVAGEARGRKLEAPPGRHTRPTADRVREAVFNALTSLDVVDGARVVDLFAGSGAMGIEALSRGAASATFVESDARAAATIERNLATTGLPGGTLVRADAPRWLETRGEMFDLALIDPPYTFAEWPRLLAALDSEFAVLESDRPLEPGLGWRVLRQKQYGSTVVAIVAAQSGPSERVTA
jgi:16S rRNA (guanine966-N2)-methyltransferase